MTQRSRRRAIVVGLLLLIAVLGARAVGDRAVEQAAFPDRASEDDSLAGLAAYVDERAVPGDVLVVPDPALRQSLDPLIQRVPAQSLPPTPATATDGPRLAGVRLGPLLRAHRRLWIAAPSDDMTAWLDEHALHVDSRTFAEQVEAAENPSRGVEDQSRGAEDHSQGPAARSNRVQLDAYELMPAPLLEDGPPRRDTVSLGGLDLLGWDVSPEPLVAGQGGRVRLIWQVARRGLPDYRVALRLIGADGREQARGDHAPYHGQRPSSTWPFGELAYEPHDLLVGPAVGPGTYRLGITVYDPATGDTFPASGPAILGEVAIASPTGPIPARSDDIPHRLGATRAGLSLLGYALPEAVGGTWTAGARLPLSVWLRVDDPARLPARLGAELVGRFGRVVASSELPLGTDGDPASAWRAGDLRQVPLPLDLPADGGDYTLRLRALDTRGRTTWLRRGSPALLPVRGLWLGRVAVAAPSRETRVPPMAHRLDLAVGEAAQLLGYDRSAGVPRPSGTLTTTLYWRATGATRVSYRATVQLVPIDPATGEPSGPPIAEHDDIPATGARPTTGWAPGEVITDRHVVALPEDMAPGDYLLIAALYDPEPTAQPRLAVTQGGRARDHVRLDRIRVATPTGRAGRSDLGAAPADEWPARPPAPTIRAGRGFP